ncbi:MAG: gas vesicle protein GvpG [Candidatus Omnitrophica bacterium]|nr:gas vesicle protein GvpG [Candidatus Omnitrophota bacterium]
MSAKKKKMSSKKKVIKEEITREKPKRKLIPFTAGKLPSLSKAMPQAASVIPLVSKEIPLVSAPIPLVSARPAHTLAKKWGLPSREWGTSKIRATRRRPTRRPTDIGLFSFLGKVITAPYQPVEMVKEITATVGAQAEEERDPKVALEQQLLELKMRREMNEISEEDYKIEETKLKKRIKDLKEKEKTKAQAVEQPKKKREKKRR